MSMSTSHGGIPHIVVVGDTEQALRRLGNWQTIEGQAQVSMHAGPLNGQPLVDALKDADAVVLLRDRTPFDAALLTQLPKLRYVIFTGSRNNTIDLSDDAKAVQAKVRQMYTDPKRVRADIPGTVEGNPVFLYHDAFNPNKDELDDLKERYRKGTVGDVEVKDKLAIAINNFLDPLRERRSHFASQKGLVEQVIYEGTEKMIALSDETVNEAFSAMGLSGYYKKISRLARERMQASS